MSEYYAVIRSGNHLEHYGVKGMKWGVRKALATGNERALDRRFRRAARKLKKLTDIGLNSKKYAAKAAAYGAAAAGTGTIAVMGTKGLSRIIRNKATSLEELAKRTEALSRPLGIYAEGHRLKSAAARATANKASKLHQKAQQIDKWGDYRKTVNTSSVVKDVGKNGTTVYRYTPGPDVKTGLSRNDKLRIGAAAATVALGAASGVNAYRAASGKKYRQKAVEYKNAMDEVFAGTKYAGKYTAEPRRKKRRNRA